MNAPATMALAFLAGAVLCLVVGRPAIRALTRAQCVAPLRYEDCPPLQTYQQGKPHTPTMGGLIVLGVGILVVAASGGLAHRDGWLVLGAVLGMGAVGLWDDWLKFRRASAVGLRTTRKASRRANRRLIAVVPRKPRRSPAHSGKSIRSDL